MALDYRGGRVFPYCFRLLFFSFLEKGGGDGNGRERNGTERNGTERKGTERKGAKHELT